MKVRRADYPELGNWQILFESQEEASAVKDYLDEILVKGVVEKAEWQHEQETSTGSPPFTGLRNG